MGFRFRKSFKVMPGVRLNLSTRGLSATVGGPGAHLNFSSRGTRATVGLPGSGLSYSTKVRGSTGSSPSPASRVPQPPKEVLQTDLTTAISSADVAELTPADMQEFHVMLSDARRQRGEIAANLKAANRELSKRTGERKWKSHPWVKWLFKKRLGALEVEIPELTDDVSHLESALENSHVEISFGTDDKSTSAYLKMVEAFDKLKECNRIWDVTSTMRINQIATRSFASEAITRKPVRIEFSRSELVRFDGRSMKWLNANGQDFYVYPGLIIVERSNGNFALLDLRTVKVTSSPRQFQESETAPKDAEFVRHTWAKVNKDGSPDRRFTSNYQIPVYNYGELEFSSATGLNERYMLSNAAATTAFGRAFQDYQSTLPALAS